MTANENEGTEIERGEELSEDQLKDIHDGEAVEAVGETSTTGQCEGADIEKVEKLFKEQPETSVVISNADLEIYKDLCASDTAWEELVKTHNTDLMEKQKAITSTIKEFWRKLAITYKLDLSKAFAISAVTGEIKEVPKAQKGEKADG